MAVNANPQAAETQVREEQWQGFRRITLSNEGVSAAFLPELGGKMVSLLRRAGGREFLLQPPEPERGYRRASLGASFEEFDTSGFDECLPTVSACQHQGRSLPDHGELWSAPWKAETRGSELFLTVEGTSFPYTLTKRVRLEASGLRIGYELRSAGAQPFDYLWSAHPLLVAEEGARILLPGEVQQVLVNWSKDDRLGRLGESCSWPVAETPGGPQRLDTLLPPSAGLADKLFTPRLRKGWCALYYPRTDESLVFSFPAAQVPYVGLWICQGGWPASRAARHYTVALEPCSGRPDSLAEAAARGEAATVRPGETICWSVNIALHAGLPSNSDARLTE